MISWTKYIPHHRRAEYEALGWVITDALKETHHGEWSYLGTWKGGENEIPPLPEGEKE